MSRPLIPANADVRLALKTCFEKDCYGFDPASLLFLKKNGMDRYATAAAGLRHLRENRHLYQKFSEDGTEILKGNYHGEVALQDDDRDIAYMHFILNVTRDKMLVRAHVNRNPASLPWI